MASEIEDDTNDSAAPSQEVAFSSDEMTLRGRFWTTEQPRAVLLIAHGLGEHSGSYDDFAGRFARSLSIDVLGFDFRGSGRSDGKRGVVRAYAELSSDLATASRWVGLHRPGLPRYLFGHSNGGLVSLRTILDDDLGLSGLIVSNPSLRLLAHVPLWKRIVGEVLLRVAPSLTLPTGLSNDQLTHDPIIAARIADDPLRHSRISPPLFFGMIANGELVLTRANQLRLPILIILGGSDPVVDPEAGRLLFERAGSDDKTLEVYPEMRHEPLNEVGRDRVERDIYAWLRNRITKSRI